MITVATRSPPEMTGRPAGDASSGPVTSTIVPGATDSRCRASMARAASSDRRRLQPVGERELPIERVGLSTFVPHEQDPVQHREAPGRARPRGRARGPRPSSRCCRLCSSMARLRASPRGADLGQERIRAAASAPADPAPGRLRKPSTAVGHFDRPRVDRAVERLQPGRAATRRRRSTAATRARVSASRRDACRRTQSTRVSPA